MGAKHSTSGAKIPLNLVIHEAQSRVVLAESNRDFVDLLLNFLVTPVGTAVRLAGGKSRLGCMDALYKSVESLDVKSFSTEACKKMLLSPINADGADCERLAVPFNDYSFRSYMCPRLADEGGKHIRLWSTMKGANCPDCGRVMDWIGGPLFSDGNPSEVGVFLRGSNKYVVTDDLRVSIIGRVLTMKECRKLGVYDFRRLREKKVEIESREVLNLFKSALTSKTPLTDTFLGGNMSEEARIDGKAFEMASNMKQPSNEEERKMTMDLVVSKSNGKLLYAQAKEDVVNFFFSFLTFPFGLISNIYNGSSSIGCIDHLWSSAKHLRDKGQVRTDEHSDMLLKPKIVAHHSLNDHILKIEEGHYELSLRSDSNGALLHAINPKISTSITAEKGGSFVNGPTTFMITDELDIKVASVSEGMSIIRNDSDIEVITVTITTKN